MNASELRIGNWIGYRDSKGNYSQFQVYEETFCDIDRMNLSPIPIPLTEEWLLKFRFEDRGPQPDSDELGRFTKYPIGLWIMDGSFITAGDFDVSLKYVHQLQNLYFALTGEELKLSE